MEEQVKIQVESKKDSLVENAAITIAELLTERLKKPIAVGEVVAELGCLKYGIISDNIPLSIEVYKGLETTGISIFYKEASVSKEKKCFINNPGGVRR